MNWISTTHCISGPSINRLIQNIKQFLQNFSIRRIKIGAVVDFLDDLDLKETKKTFAALMLTLKVIYSVRFSLCYFL